MRAEGVCADWPLGLLSLASSIPVDPCCWPGGSGLAGFGWDRAFQQGPERRCHVPGKASGPSSLGPQ